MDQFGKIWDAISANKLWIFAAVAAGCAVILFVPAIAGVDFAAVRKTHASLLLVGLVFGLMLLFFGALSKGVAAARASPWFVPGIVSTVDAQRSFIAQAQQPDHSVTTQIYIALRAHNASAKGLTIERVALVWPPWWPGRTATYTYLVGQLGGVERRHAVIPPGLTREVDITVLLQGGHARATKGGLKVALGLFDQAGRRHMVEARLRMPN